MPKKRDETFADFLVRMAGLLCEAIEEVAEKGDLDAAGLLLLALLDIERLREFEDARPGLCTT
jgi:hypothetical protein